LISRIEAEAEEGKNRLETEEMDAGQQEGKKK